MLEATDHAAQHMTHQHEEWSAMLAVVCFGLHQAEHGKIKTAYPLSHIPKLAGLFLMHLEVPKANKRSALKLMGYAHVPFLMATETITATTLRFMAADLFKEGLSMEQLAWVSHQWGCAHTFKFLEAARQAGALDPKKIKPCVHGKHLMEIGLRPGLDFKNILEECFKIQLEQGIYNPSKILEQQCQGR